MSFEIVEITLALPTFALVLFRFTGLIMVAPVLGSRMVPVRLRAGLTVVLAAMIFPLVRSQAPADLSLSAALVGGVGEMIIGVTIGLAVSMILLGVEVAGLIVGQQGGIALGQVFNPTTNQQTNVVSQIFSTVMLLVFLSLDGHRAMVSALLDTFETVPLLSFQFNESFVLLLLEALTGAFILAIRLSGPVVIALFLTAVALGFLSRTVPQLNILSVGFTVRVMVALGFSGLALMASGDLMVDAVHNGLDLIRETFQLAPAPL